MIHCKGISQDRRGITGPYNVCLTNKSLTFLRQGQSKTLPFDDRLEQVEFLFTTIRRYFLQIH